MYSHHHQQQHKVTALNSFFTASEQLLTASEQIVEPLERCAWFEKALPKGKEHPHFETLKHIYVIVSCILYTQQQTSHHIEDTQFKSTSQLFYL